MNSSEKRDEDLAVIKKRIKNYSRAQIQFNEPHFTRQIALREGNRNELIGHLLDLESLLAVQSEQGRYGDRIYLLYFKISDERTLKIPLIFNRNAQQNLYILTYIMRFRSWKVEKEERDNKQ